MKWRRKFGSRAVHEHDLRIDRGRCAQFTFVAMVRIVFLAGSETVLHSDRLFQNMPQNKNTSKIESQYAYSSKRNIEASRFPFPDFGHGWGILPERSLVDSPARERPRPLARPLLRRL